jgi:hypothetical protein
MSPIHSSGQCESVCRRDLLAFLDGNSSSDSAGEVGIDAVLGGYSQNFLSQILKIFVTLTWILEPIKHKI